MNIPSNERSRLGLERRIHALLCEDVPASEEENLLATLAGDPDARELLREMRATQSGVRRVFGYDRAEGAMRESLARLLESLDKPE